MLNSARPPIHVYEDQEVAAFWLAGATEHAVLTFGDALEPASGNRFFADSSARKLGAACLGIMSRRPHWYPQACMIRVAEAAEPHLRPHSLRIGYGGSMGGYAAVKYSRLFDTTQTLALSPQWSIDRADCNGEEPGFQQYFSPYMTGHRINPADVQGRVYLFFDPLDPVDRFHAGKIACLFDDIAVVAMPYVGHNVTRALAGSTNLKMIIEAALRRDDLRIRSLAASLRRASPERAHSLLANSHRRYPRLAARAARHPCAKAPNNLGCQTDYLLPLTRHLRELGLEKEADDLVPLIQAALRETGR